jgi:predicted HTH transcriptional regulator
MTSMIAHLLMGKPVQHHVEGRLIRFGETTSNTLTRGPINERVLCCLRGATAPMRLADISEAIKDYDSRAKKTLQKLVKAGLVEAIGPEGYGQRFRLR